MAKNSRKHAYSGSHSKVPYPKKQGRPREPKGKQVNKALAQRTKASEKAEKLKKNEKLVAALALSSGESMDVGMARMALIVTLKLVDEAKLEVDGDLKYTPLVGLSGKLGSGLVNVEHWTSTDDTCLDIKDIGADDDDLFEEEEQAGGAQVLQAAQEDIQVAAAHVGEGNEGAEGGVEAAVVVGVAAMADA